MQEDEMEVLNLKIKNHDDDAIYDATMRDRSSISLGEISKVMKT